MQAARANVPSPYEVVLGTCGSPQSLPQIDEKASLYSRTTAAPTHNRCRHHRRGVSGHAQVRTVRRLSASNVYLTDRICVSKTVLYLPSTTSRLMPKHIRNQHRPCNHTNITQLSRPQNTTHMYLNLFARTRQVMASPNTTPTMPNHHPSPG